MKPLRNRVASTGESGEHAPQLKAAAQVEIGMNASYSDADIDPREPGVRERLRFELIFASVWLAVGLFVMPGLIYAVGVLLLGPYGESAGLGTFYADFFRDLAEPAGRVWTIALGPLVLITVLRLLFLDVRRRNDEETREPAERRQTAREQSRVEPRISHE